MRTELTPGVYYWPGYIGGHSQRILVDEVLRLTVGAPFYRPRMPRTGHKLSVEMTNFGPLGWFTDTAMGYRYEERHPERGTPWPAIPNSLLTIWDETTGYEARPEACLVNLYRAGTRMGLHRDQDEDARDAPVVSVSLGDSAVFRFGPARTHKFTQTVVLEIGRLAGVRRARPVDVPRNRSNPVGHQQSHARRGQNKLDATPGYVARKKRRPIRGVIGRQMRCSRWAPGGDKPAALGDAIRSASGGHADGRYSVPPQLVYAQMPQFSTFASLQSMNYILGLDSDIFITWR